MGWAFLWSVLASSVYLKTLTELCSNLLSLPSISGAPTALFLQRTEWLFLKTVAPILKALVDIDGVSNSWSGFYLALMSNAVVIKVESAMQQWYYGALKPWKHYIPVAANLTDLGAAVRHALNVSHIREMQDMMGNATEVINKITYKGEVERLANQLAQVFASAALKHHGAPVFHQSLAHEVSNLKLAEQAVADEHLAKKRSKKRAKAKAARADAALAAAALADLPPKRHGK
ncbi:hypothetical protein CYMTET_40287 [Cymbomonas tetramitiformis]|uniref:Glycosyl transferase CAP10 domain-containing protein n=1 Tax=Cymbomonas tetramitiformis TaxID=36881 RepID=A0AAE0F345_9CHLO|nr:hypothetical protein CYMTET_40287 [Cymbomonas tetramitiformis]